VENKKLAVVLASEKESEKTLYFRLKQIVEYISSHIMHIAVDYSSKTENKIYHPVNSCAVSSNGTVLGEMGILHPVVAKNIDKRKVFAVLELDVNKMLEMETVSFKVKQTSKYQSVSVDYNFVADKTMPYGEIEKALNEFRASYILEHSLKDIYINEEILPGKISYTINFIVTPKDKTLESSDIEKFSMRLIDHMKKIGVELRS
jgi:phenylalanyl-tRNA synthetase beta chain